MKNLLKNYGITDTNLLGKYFYSSVSTGYITKFRIDNDSIHIGFKSLIDTKTKPRCWCGSLDMDSNSSSNVRYMVENILRNIRLQSYCKLRFLIALSRYNMMNKSNHDFDDIPITDYSNEEWEFNTDFSYGDREITKCKIDNVDGFIKVLKSNGIQNTLNKFDLGSLIPSRYHRDMIEELDIIPINESTAKDILAYVMDNMLYDQTDQRKFHLIEDYLDTDSEWI